MQDRQPCIPRRELQQIQSQEYIYFYLYRRTPRQFRSAVLPTKPRLTLQTHSPRFPDKQQQSNSVIASCLAKLFLQGHVNCLSPKCIFSCRLRSCCRTNPARQVASIQPNYRINVSECAKFQFVKGLNAEDRMVYEVQRPLLNVTLR